MQAEALNLQVCSLKIINAQGTKSQDFELRVSGTEFARLCAHACTCVCVRSGLCLQDDKLKHPHSVMHRGVSAAQWQRDGCDCLRD